jgi:SEC-C motif-containing protein
MRSRYAAYVLDKIDYIEKTHDPAKRHEMDRNGAEEWSTSAEWVGLDVNATEKGGEGDDEGVVEFTAKYEIAEKLINHRERAYFKRIDGRWYYHDGDMIKPKPMVREARKVGRNEPCPCGSGKKYKKCCAK